jgi:prevent-host-death family protein
MTCYAAAMLRIGIRELRQNASRYLARVKAGETIEITERGKLIALINPPSKEQTALERLIAEGKLIPAKHPFRLPKRVPLKPGLPTPSQILDELREERL